MKIDTPSILTFITFIKNLLLEITKKKVTILSSIYPTCANPTFLVMSSFRLNSPLSFTLVSEPCFFVLLFVMNLFVQSLLIPHRLFFISGFLSALSPFRPLGLFFSLKKYCLFLYFDCGLYG